MTKIGEKNDVLTNVTHVSKERTQVVLDFLADILKETYSPFGSTVMLQDQATKDGITVFNHIHLQDEDDAMVYNFVKSVCQRALFTGGDNTTTAVILTSSLFREVLALWKLNENKMTAREFNYRFREAVETVSGELHKRAIKTPTLQQILSVVKVSLNHDESHLKVFTDIYNDAKKNQIPFNNLNIYARKGYGFKETRYEISKGFIVDQPIEYRDKADTELITLTVKVIPYATKVETVEDFEFVKSLINTTAKTNQPTLFIGYEMREAYKDLIKSSISAHYNKSGMVIPIYFMFTETLDNTIMDAKTFSDLYSLLGITPFYLSDKDNMEFTPEMYDYYPTATLNMYRNKTEFIDVKPVDNRLLTMRVNEIKNLMENAEFNEKSLLESRLNKLTANVAIIFVACETEEESSRVYDAFEDATAVLRCALESGIIEGSNIAIPKTIYNMDTRETDRLFLDTIANAYKNLWRLIIDMAGTTGGDEEIDKLYKILIGNKDYLTYDVVTKELSESILHSVELETRVLKAASEIVSILVTSNIMLLSNVYAKNYYVGKLSKK